MTENDLSLVAAALVMTTALFAGLFIFCLIECYKLRLRLISFQIELFRTYGYRIPIAVDESYDISVRLIDSEGKAHYMETKGFVGLPVHYYQGPITWNETTSYPGELKLVFEIPQNTPIKLSSSEFGELEKVLGQIKRETKDV